MLTTAAMWVSDAAFKTWSVPLLVLTDNSLRHHEFLGAGRGIKLHGERHDLEEEDRADAHQRRAYGPWSCASAN